jgi:phage-related protein
MEHGPAGLPPKYVKHISDKVWELRMTGRDGIARAFYVAASGQRVVIGAFSRKRRRKHRYAKSSWP